MSRSKQPRPYVRRSERVGGEVRTHYLGRTTDPVTRILVDSEKLSRANSQIDQEVASRELAMQEQFEICQKYLANRAMRLFWRFRSGFFDDADQGSSKHVTKERKVKGSHNHEPDTLAVEFDDWAEIIEGASEGDADAIQELNHILRYHPQIPERLGNLSRHIQSTLIDLVGAECIATRESLKIQVEELRGELDKTNAGPLERLLIEQVIATLLDLAVQQLGCLKQHAKESLRMRWERRMDRAQKRHLAAVTALAQLRKMLCKSVESA